MGKRNKEGIWEVHGSEGSGTWELLKLCPYLLNQALLSVIRRRKKGVSINLVVLISSLGLNFISFDIFSFCCLRMTLMQWNTVY